MTPISLLSVSSPSSPFLHYSLVTLLKVGLICFSFCLTLSAIPQLAAQSGVSPSLAAQNERAIIRSQENLAKAQSLMEQALEKRSQHNLDAAYQNAVEALRIAPSGPAVASARSALIAGYSSIALDESRELIKGGHYLEAQTVAKSVLEPAVDPGNKVAVRILSDLEQPEVYNKTVTPKFASQRDQVVQLLREGDGLTQSGRYDLALKRYDAVLRIDPYNNAARKGMEAIHNATIKYDDEAYNETRSRISGRSRRHGSVLLARPKKAVPRNPWDASRIFVGPIRL